MIHNPAQQSQRQDVDTLARQFTRLFDRLHQLDPLQDPEDALDCLEAIGTACSRTARSRREASGDIAALLDDLIDELAVVSGRWAGVSVPETQDDATALAFAVSSLAELVDPPRAVLRGRTLAAA